MTTRRIITKVGFVYKTTEKIKYRKYIQLIYLDRLQLNSDVIAVFPNEGQTPYEEAVKTRPDFFTHTTVKQGVSMGFWEKVGKAPVTINVRNLNFRMYQNQQVINALHEVYKHNPAVTRKPPFHEPYWATWKLGDSDFSYLREKVGKDSPAEIGSIYPANIIADRIAGQWPPAQPTSTSTVSA